ncbi:alkaline phosphatase [Thermoleptolyngbya sichuanensis XZ-Cy5]|uniref:alkaline phosphatase n=1 Tax=Thermoleptolyngbya sichuanensis TaxID=2885951 RepID=UPI00240DB677|nr:alkaline phosphatase [Thermoleptolyngbya sichuanensis XZ-Cy5]
MAPAWADLGTTTSSLIQIWPVNNTTLLVDQRFDLRVESLVPSTTPPMLKSLAINGRDVTETFKAGIAAEMAMPSGELEVGMPPAGSGLFGQSLRNYSFSEPGNYQVVATVTINGRDERAVNTYRVQKFSPSGNLNKIVLMIGDGMGTPLRTGARILRHGVKYGQPGGRLNMEQFPEMALVSTHSLDSIIPDSANTAAAYTSGAKTINGAMSAFPDNTPENPLDNPRIETFPQYMKRKYGWGFGMVTTAYLTDATPGSAAANIIKRSEGEAIAQQFLDVFEDGFTVPKAGYQSWAELSQPVDVAMGPGARHFVPESRIAEFKDSRFRKDGKDITAVARQKGYSVVTNVDELKAAPNDKPLLGLYLGDFRPDSALGPQNIPSILDLLIARGEATINGKSASQLTPPIPPEFAKIPTLPEMTEKAIAILNTRTPQGWFLLVESSQSDKLAHSLDTDRTLYEVLELDNTVGIVRDFAQRDGKTLVMVTADHAQGQTVAGTVDTLAIKERRIDLRDALRAFEDASFPTYADANGDGYPDEANPSIKMVLGVSARPAYRTDFLTDEHNLNPSVPKDGSTVNPARDPGGLLLTADLQRSVDYTNHTGDDVPFAAEGPGEALFNGTLDNIEVFQRIAAAVSGVTQRRDLPSLLR